MSDALSDAGALPAGGDLRRWTASLVVVLAAHAASGAVLLAWRAPADSAAPSGAVMIDLTPLPEPAPTPPAETAAAPAPSERPAEPPLPEPQPPEPEPIPEPLPDLQPSPAPAPEVAVATPPPRSKPRPPERPQPVAKPAEPRPPVSAPAPPSVAAPAPVASAPSGVVRSWQGEVLAHLERHKRYPRAAQARRQQGVAHVRFVIDRQGRVLSRSLEKGSGVAALDEETLAMVERADPVPAPPPDTAQSRIELVVPVVYAIK